MDAAQELLYGDFPRRAGTPEQFWVYSAGHLDLVLDKVCGRRNSYATLSWFPDGFTPTCDKVALDFDAPEKETDWGYAEARQLLDDREFAQAVLDPIVDDVGQLANQLRDEGQPALGVFTGFGIHVHLLYQPCEEPQQAMESTAVKYVDKCGLETVDHAPIGDVQRIMRVPNMQRVEDEQACGIWTVPLTLRELDDLTVEWLVDTCRAPRRDIAVTDASRSEMPVHQEYLGSDLGGTVEQNDVEVEFADLDDEFLKFGLEKLLRMPCMYERALQPNPSHEVRRNVAILLFNVGLTPDQVLSLIERLGWKNFDRGITRKQLTQIYETGYSDMNCETIKRKGLCTRLDEPCPTEGWSGGRAEWIESNL